MINPSAVDVAALPSVPLADRNALPAEPCIYFAIDAQGVVQYVGRSVNPKQRWRQHHRYEDLSVMSGVRISYLFVDSEVIDATERALISWFNPPLNRRKILIDEAPQKRGNALKNMRLRQGLTREEVAIQCRVTAPTVANWECGRTIPCGTAEFFIAFCKCYGCEFEELAKMCEAQP